MREVLEAFPGAQRALFRHYHIGGCASCAFRPEETLEELCQRNQISDVTGVIGRIREGHEEDEKFWISPAELKKKMDSSEERFLLDVRTREEWEGVKIENSQLFTEQVIQDLLSKWPREKLLVIYDHLGTKSLNAAAYFTGHGFLNVKCLRGGIDAWAREVDPKLPRYQLEQTTETPKY